MTNDQWKATRAIWTDRVRERFKVRLGMACSTDYQDYPRSSASVSTSLEAIFHLLGADMNLEYDGIGQEPLSWIAGTRSG